MIIVHHLNNSHSHVVLWLMEELGLDYEIVAHRRDPQTFLSPDTLRAVHPAAKAPTIEDNGIAMVESAGIILYLLETYGAGRLRPAPGTADAMRFYQWLTFIEGSAKTPLMRLLQFLYVPDEAGKAQALIYLGKYLDLIEAGLAGHDMIVGDQFTAADMQLAFFEELVEAFGRIGPYPAMQGHLARMRQREGYKRAEAKGGPVGLMEMFGGMR